MNAARTLAPALGWFGIVLGALEVVAPKRVAKAVGSNNHSLLVRAFGAREIGAGVALLSRQDPSRGLWLRVAGDVLDLSMLALSLRNRHNDRRRLGTALAALGAVAVADLYAAVDASRNADGRTRKGPIFTKTVSMMVGQPDLFRRLADASWLREYVPGLERAAIEIGSSDEPSLIEYRIGGDSPFALDLHVALRDAGAERGTVLRLDALPAHSNGAAVHALHAAAELGGDALAVGLHRLKNLVELGEVVSNDGPSGRSMKKGKP